MKAIVKRILASLVSGMVSGVLAVDASDSFDPTNAICRTAHFRETITPPVGMRVAGYGTDVPSIGVDDDLEVCGAVFDTDESRVALISFDLLGLDSDTVRKFRRRFAKTLGVTPTDVMLTCTHTHEGPHSRDYILGTGDMERLPGADARNLEIAYLDSVADKVDAALLNIVSGKRWRTSFIGFHSTQVDANVNRRYTTADNCASFIPLNRRLLKLADGYVDREFGVLALLDAETFQPHLVIGNYAAHPLDAHSVGTGFNRFSADFPGVFRRYVVAETGAEAMFVQGAAGDVISRHSELGRAGMRRIGEDLGMAAIASVLDIRRNRSRYVLDRARVGALSRRFPSRIRKHYRPYFDRDDIDLEVQILAVGDVCFVGVPGEALCELGQQIKWNSPFKRTFIAYCSTGYSGYLAPLSMVCAGGFEGNEQRFASRDVLRLVTEATDGMLELRQKLFPEDSAEGEDPYPDNLRSPVSNVPGMVKPGRFDAAEDHLPADGESATSCNDKERLIRK